MLRKRLAHTHTHDAVCARASCVFPMAISSRQLDITFLGPRNENKVMRRKEITKRLIQQQQQP